MEENKKYQVTAFFCKDINLWIEFYATCIKRKIPKDDLGAREMLLFDLMNKRQFLNCSITKWDKPMHEVVSHYQDIYEDVVNLTSPKELAKFKKEMEAMKMSDNVCKSCKKQTVLNDNGEMCINSECLLNNIQIYYDPETDIESNWTDEGFKIEPQEEEQV